MTKPKTKFSDRSAPLVAELVRIADPEKRDRAGLARLRAALQPSRRLEALPLVVRHVDQTDHAEDAAILLAGLFALHPHHARRANLGKVLGSLNASEQGAGGIEARFRALLSCSATELPVHLRHAVSFIAGHERSPGIDYIDLHGAIHFWDREDNTARRRWARDFWTPRPSTSTDDADDGATSPA